MGIADDIINLAFGLSLGARAVATALAFGTWFKRNRCKTTRRVDEKE
jgi:hypothetical protein